MKTGLNITQLAQEIQRQQDAKKDYQLTTNNMRATHDGKVELKGQGIFELTDNAHSQIAQRLKIPKQYYDRMKVEAPQLWTSNVDHWLHNNREKRLVRTLDGKVRAFLSDRYRALDNLELMETVLPVLAQRKDIKFESSQVTSDKLYLKCFFTDLEKTVTESSQVNDIIRGGLLISNSETGNGSLQVAPMTYRLVCTNGMISPTAMKKYHVGRGNGTSFEDIQEVLTDESKRLNDQAFWHSVRDIIAHNLRPEVFEQEVNKFNEAAGVKIESDIIDVVDNTAKKYSFNEDQKKSVLDHLIKGGDLSKWGLANAVTRTAEDQESYDEATNFEAIGGKIIHLNKTEWKQIEAV